MKAILEFDLPGDQAEFNLAQLGSELHTLVFDMLNGDLRNWLKYGHKFATADEALEKVREVLVEKINSLSIDFDSIP